MFKQISAFLVIVMVSMTAIAAPSPTLKKLKSYSIKEASTKTPVILKTIEDTVDAIVAGKEKSNPEVLRELVRVAVLTFKNDPSMAAAELLLPLYKQDKKSFDEALKHLPKEDAQELEESIQNAEKESSAGNG